MKTYTLGEIAYKTYVGTETAAPSFDQLSEPSKQIWNNVGHRVAASVGRADATEGDADFGTD